MAPHRSTDDDDISPIRASLPEGPPAPIIPIVLEWGLLAAAGFTMRVSPDVTPTHGALQLAGLALSAIAAIVAFRLVTLKSVTARMSGGAGLLIAATEFSYLLWLITKKPGG